MYQLTREITLNVPREVLWHFMATPANLNALTPAQLHFKILSDVPERMHNGLLIEYLIRLPLFGCWRWLTEIKHIEEGWSFVDEQRCGPYRFWYHHHQLAEVDRQTTRMTDRVSYKLPCGPLGRIVHRAKVRPMLNDIFAYRATALADLFGSPED